MKKIISIVILALVGIFIHPFSPGTLDFIFRFVIFSAITYLVYSQYRPELKDQIDTTKNENLAKKEPMVEDRIPETWSMEQLLKQDDRTEKFLLDLFEILENLFFPNNGWIFYKIHNDMKVYHYHGISENLPLPQEQKIEIIGLMQILDESDDIIMENNFKGEQNLLNFYDNLEYVPCSFLGIPLKIDSDSKLFFAFDANTNEHFNKDDISVIKKLVDYSQIFLFNRLKGVSLLEDLKENKALLEFATDINGSKNLAIALSKLVEKISYEFEASRLTVSFVRNDASVAVIKRVIGQIDDFAENTEFTLEEGLTGWVISKNKPYLIEDLEKGDYFIPRYSKEEKTNFGLRSFLGVPISIQEKIFGAITLEHSLPQKYGTGEKVKLQKIIDIFSTTLLRSTT